MRRRPPIRGHERDLELGRHRAGEVARAIAELKAVASSYFAESSYSEPSWQAAYWGPHHTSLATIQQVYDPDDLFDVHHGVGSERCSPDSSTG